MPRIGVISDTHGLLRDEAANCLEGSALIIHAGDIGSAAVISQLEQIAPVRAIRGNVDRGAWASAFPGDLLFEVQDQRIYVVHDIKTMDFDPAARGVRVVISGHSHRPKIETVDGVLHVNPGSAGPRRFRLPVALATLSVSRSRVSARIHHLQP